MLDPIELKDIQRRYEEQRANYEMLSDRILARCMDYRRQNPKAVRIVFSRQPRIKTLDSITQKIEDIRKTGNCTFQDITDVIALTVLCTYSSDIPPFLVWLRRSFDVTPGLDDDALRQYESGHRGYHFVMRLGTSEQAADPHLNLPCELQVKTVIEEAFDAKSHDLAYKPGYLEVGKELKEQFSILSTALHAIDRQSEFLKTLILQEEHDINLRRSACIELYLQNFEDVPTQIGLNP